MTRTALLVAAFCAAGLPALADSPRVATDIPPVHSLVARVMQGVGEPELVLPPGASPHGHAMRPSEAAALAGADVLVWMGPALTPWLERAVGSLAEEVRSVELLDSEGTLLLDFREGATFGDQAHGGGGEHTGGDAGGDDHGHEHADEDDHGHDHEASEDDEEGHAHTGADPHAWLDPENAKVWLGTIAGALAEADPENAAAYLANADAARGELDALIAELSAGLDAVRGEPFIVFHDAYHYFERRFGVEAVGAIALADASAPGPARIAEIRDIIARTGSACVFAEPQFPAELIATVTEGSEARAATLDPVGVALSPGPGLYPQLLRDLATALRGCLDPAA